MIEQKVVQIHVSRFKPHPLIAKIIARDDRYSDKRIMELADSIRTVGQVLPVVATEAEEKGYYYLVDGHRRVKALSLLCQQDEQYCYANTVLVKDTSDLALFINELATSYKPSTLVVLVKELIGKGYSQKQIAQAMGKNKGYVSMLVKISEHSDIIKAVDEGLDLRVAYELSKIADKRLRKRLLREVKGMGRTKAISHIRETVIKHSPKNETKSLTVKPPVEVKVEHVEKAVDVKTCFICGKTFRSRDVQRIDVCANDLYMLSTLMQEMAKKGLTWDDLLKYVRKRKPKKVIG